MKIQEVIDRIIAYHPPMAPDEHHPTCDTIKCGDMERECTGVTVTCFASADVIRQAAALGDNLIVAHEPLFWSDNEDTAGMEESPVLKGKKALLEQNGITVWRDHDHIHGGSPVHPPLDGIYYGIMKELGWENYCIGDPTKPLLFQIPETDAERLGEYLKEKLGLKGLRIVGDRHAKVSKVFLWEHISAKDWNGQQQRKLLKVDSEGIDAVIPLEMIDWTVCAYIRDAAQLGCPKVLYNPGHFNFEELGMKHMLSYLSGLLDDQVPCHFVSAGDAFDFI